MTPYDQCRTRPNFAGNGGHLPDEPACSIPAEGRIVKADNSNANNEDIRYQEKEGCQKNGDHDGGYPCRHHNDTASYPANPSTDRADSRNEAFIDPADEYMGQCQLINQSGPMIINCPAASGRGINMSFRLKAGIQKGSIDSRLRGNDVTWQTKRSMPK